MVVEPIPETEQALAQLSNTTPVDLVASLQDQVARAKEIVPELMGASLAATAEGLTFTFVASSQLIATLDALQYLDGGPCVQAVRRRGVVDVPVVDALDEGQWELFSQAEATAGVAATLSLPVLSGDRATGSVNLYASRSGAFRGRQFGQMLQQSVDQRPTAEPVVRRLARGERRGGRRNWTKFRILGPAGGEALRPCRFPAMRAVRGDGRPACMRYNDRSPRKAAPVPLGRDGPVRTPHAAGFEPAGLIAGPLWSRSPRSPAKVLHGSCFDQAAGV